MLTSSPAEGGSRTPPRPLGTPAPPRRARPRRLTLGPCAHCHRQVDFTDDFVRLHRRAWHLSCALIAGEPVAH